MKKQSISRFVLFGLVLGMAAFCTAAEEQSRSRRRRGIYGDWVVKMQFNERTFESIINFSRDSEGNRTASWISPWGIMELKDVKIEDGNISFKQERKNREGETVTSTFTGTIAEGKLSGTLKSERGETKIEGQPSPRTPRAVGTWEITFKVGEREMTTSLVITADKEGKLNIDWKSERVKHAISDVKYERGTLSFSSTSTMGERTWKSTFEGRLRRDTLEGVLKSERGEMPIAGKMVTNPLMGTWMLEIASERGARKQRLRVNRDMSGLYGTLPIKKIELKENKVTFPIVMEFGDRKFELSFKGELKEEKLTGEITSSMGTQKVTGTKVVRRFVRRRRD